MVKKLFVLAGLVIWILSCDKPAMDNISSRSPEISSLKTFGTMGKELKVLKRDIETELFNYKGKGALTHMWFGGQELDHIDIKVYIDNEEQASIDMEMYLGHGIGFKDNYAPWGTERMGNIGGGSGIYNTYKIPFGENIKICAQLDSSGEEMQNFWWIIRGTENLPIEFAGIKLPESARLKLYKLENYTAEPLEEFTMCNVKGAGMLYQVTMEAKGLRDTGHWKDIS